MQDAPPPQQPPQYAAYPRGAAQYGSAHKLKALSDGYFGLNGVFLLNVVLALGANAATGGFGGDFNPGTFLLVALLLFGVIAAATYPFNKKIAEGKGWSNGGAVLASVLMGLNSAFCCGVIGYLVMQSIAAGEMRKYGLQTRFLGFNKKDVERKIAELRAQEFPPSPGPYVHPPAV